MEPLVDLYKQAMLKADPRTEDWFFMSSPLPTVAVVVLYLLVTYKGQTWMKDRPAFNLKSVILVYNAFLVILSAYMVFELMMSSWLVPGFSITCEVINYSPSNPLAVRLAKVVWWFYFSKIIELMDTMFFMLRKKNNQISFLHVYHHATMPLLWWIGARFVAGGEAFFCSTINSGIHTLMYTYYLLSAMGPAMQPYLWWKRYMTSLQLIQFWLIVFKTCYSLYLNCGYPRAYGVALVLYCFSHIVLFSNFYYQTYTKKAQLLRQKKRDENGITGTNGTTNGSLSHEESNNNKHAYGNGHILNGHSQVQTRKVK